MTPCVRVKDGVKFDRISPAGFKMLAVIQNATYIFDRDLTITCGTDSHPPTDPHSRGEAYDLRTIGMSDQVIKELVAYLKTQLGPLFFVQYETPGVNLTATAAHIHMQLAQHADYPPLT